MSALQKRQEINPLIPMRARVERVIRETPDTVTLYLRSLDGAFRRFLPGQFSMLYVFGVGEVPISISGDPEEKSFQAYTVRKVGVVTGALTRLKPGDILGVRGPYGTSWPLEEAREKDLVIVAGGIGLAPLRPAIYQILRDRRSYGMVWILYGARTPRDLLYRKELMRWRGMLDLEVLVTVDAGPPNWRGRVGVVTTLFPSIRLDPDNTVAMVCGPEIMMRFTVKELEKMGVSHENIYISMERSMKCATGFCGHCQFGWHFLCLDGPVFQYSKIKKLFEVREI